MFEHPTYVVLELPGPIADAVQALRERYDPRLAGYPAEITVAGSSGIGPVLAGQSPEAVFARLQAIADRHLPITARFAQWRRFASGPVTWLALAQPAPLRALHQAVADSGIGFAPHRFEFTPHCSACTLELPAARQAQLLVEPVPAGDFMLTRLAAYAVAGDQPQLLWRSRVRDGRAN